MSVTESCRAWLLADPAIREFISGNRRPSLTAAPVAIIPVGSLEQHGPHLPVSTDFDIASEVSRLVAERNGYLLMPALPYGVSYEHAPLFHSSISANTLSCIMTDLCKSLHANGINCIIVINGHHGNMDALDMFENMIREQRSEIDNYTKEPNDDTNRGVPVVRVFHYWRHMQHELGHAGFAETSMMLAISADSVNMDVAQKGLVTAGMDAEQIRDLSELAKRSFPAATGNGVWGDPVNATAKEGRCMLNEAADNIGKACDAWLESKTEQHA